MADYRRQDDERRRRREADWSDGLDEFTRWSAPAEDAAWIDGPPRLTRRERGGYWRYYGTRAQGIPDPPSYAGRGPRDYQRPDERVREEICDCMTEDPLLDASEITVSVTNGVVTLDGTVSTREQKRRAEDVAERITGVKDVTNQLRVSRAAYGHSHTASLPVAQAFGQGTPSKSTSGTST